MDVWLSLPLIIPFRTRCMYNYVGSMIGFGVYIFVCPDPTLFERLVGLCSNIIGSQLPAIGMMIIPKLFVPVSHKMIRNLL